MTRAFVLLAVSLLAGALVAQDRNETLRDRVHALRLEIEARTRAVAPDPRIERTYDVGELLAQPPTSSTAPRDLPISQHVPPELGSWVQPLPAWDPEALLDFVAEAVGTDARLALHAGRLRVFGPPVIHERVEQLLSFLAERTRDRLIVEIELLPLEEDAAPLGRAIIRCANGTEQAFDATTDRRYLFDYDEESAREAGIGDPLTASVSEGLAGDVLLCLDRQAGGVLAHMRIHWQRLASEPRSADTQHGPVTLPVLDVVRLRTSTWLPFDRRVVVANCTRGMTPCRVVVRLRLAEE